MYRRPVRFKGITFVPLDEELIAADSGLLPLFYADEAAFNGLARGSAHLLNLLMKKGSDRGYLSEPSRSLLILDTPGKEEVARREFAAEGIELNFVSGSRYLGVYLGP